jgi:2-polyprenyl-3-methyl-5-hydroxy-6-metoxy-1,4-benzoquinol methylase
MSGQKETMERIIPDMITAGDETAQLSLKLHLERYRFACDHLRPGRVLDIACGAGYGTSILAECSGSECVGVDVSAEAIRYAANRYAHPRISFIQQSLMDFNDNRKFHNIISLETIEHVHEPAKAIAHLNNLLLPGGHLIISAPVTPSMDGNPYHVNDFSTRSFRKLFKNTGLVEVDSLQQKQPYSLKDVMGKKEGRKSELRSGLAGYYLSHPGKFFLRVRSLFADGLSNNYLVLVLMKAEPQ